MGIHTLSSDAIIKLRREGGGGGELASTYRLLAVIAEAFSAAVFASRLRS